MKFAFTDHIAVISVWQERQIMKTRQINITIDVSFDVSADVDFNPENLAHQAGIAARDVVTAKLGKHDSLKMASFQGIVTTDNTVEE